MQPYPKKSLPVESAAPCVFCGQWAALLRPKILGWLLFACAVIAVISSGLIAAPSPSQKAALLIMAAIGLWVTRAIPEHLTALLFFLVSMVFSIAPANVIFSGFESTAWWLIFGGLVVGLAIKQSGFGDRIAHRLAKHMGKSYVGIITIIVLIGMVLGFLMPSSVGRAVLMMPIALELAERVGFPANSRGRTGIVLAAAFGSHVPTFAILPSNVPNMVLSGAAEAQYHLAFRYGEYLLLHFPVLGLLKAVLLVFLIVWLFPDQPLRRPRDVEASLQPISAQERKLAVILVLSLTLWATDFLHHISPAWVSLAAAVICLIPGIGLLSPNAVSEQINYGPLLFVAGIMGLGALVSQSGLGPEISNHILSILALEPGANARNFAALTLTSTLIGTITTLPGVPAVLTPLAGEMAHSSGLPIKTVLMTQVVGFSTMLLPYQSAPLVVAMQLGQESIRAAMKLCLALAAATVLLLPLDYFWWHLLGWI